MPEEGKEGEEEGQEEGEREKEVEEAEDGVSQFVSHFNRTLVYLSAAFKSSEVITWTSL